MPQYVQLQLVMAHCSLYHGRTNIMYDNGLVDSRSTSRKAVDKP